ncbi:scavenger receptor cysteine-rich domain-containing protein DMBT1-like [Mytilus edulis]|uniref:scavenger receptor cysteine-rich domain-containing protein DMBT1-like n=1 Tax=Mytilus edulis TaxID=6550 RepID=UPI0039EEEB04
MKFVFVLAIFIVCAAAVTILKVKNTRQCKAGGGICKQTCAVDEEDTGSCCRNSYRCCQPPTCNDTLQHAQCKAKNGESKPVCDVNEQDTGIGPFCNPNRCCEPPTCIASVDCNCKSSTSSCHWKNEYQDNAGNCSGSDKCCKPCCFTCGGTFKGPEGRLTSPHYPLNYCNEQRCTYTIIVEEGSKVMLNFTFVELEPYFADTVKVYDGEISTDTLLATLDDGPFEGLEFNSTSNKMIIVFKSDTITVFPGFSAIYKTLQ